MPNLKGRELVLLEIYNRYENIIPITITYSARYGGTTFRRHSSLKDVLFETYEDLVDVINSLRVRSVLKFAFLKYILTDFGKKKLEKYSKHPREFIKITSSCAGLPFLFLHALQN